MAIPWFTILQAVPWTEVICNAPKVADGAKRLLGMASRQPPAPPAAAAGATESAALEARVQALEATVAELHQQMLASSQLIKDLAEQNAQLIRRIEANRVRMRWLGAATALAIAAIIWLFATSA